jgi:hypothetical protein
VGVLKSVRVYPFELNSKYSYLEERVSCNLYYWHGREFWKIVSANANISKEVMLESSEPHEMLTASRKENTSPSYSLCNFIQEPSSISERLHCGTAELARNARDTGIQNLLEHLGRQLGDDTSIFPIRDGMMAELELIERDLLARVETEGL